MELMSKADAFREAADFQRIARIEGRRSAMAAAYSRGSGRKVGFKDRANLAFARHSNIEAGGGQRLKDVVRQDQKLGEEAKRRMKDYRDRGISKAFATRDQNSSIGTTTTRRGPVGRGQRPTLTSRSGYFEGKTRGVGRRNEGRDANSSPRVTRVQPRSPQGRFVSHENDLKIIHPSGRVTRQPKTSALGIHRKGGGSETRGYVEKSYTMDGTLGSQATGVVRDGGAFGRGNSRFGGSGTRGKRLA